MVLSFVLSMDSVESEKGKGPFGLARCSRKLFHGRAVAVAHNGVGLTTQGAAVYTREYLYSTRLHLQIPAAVVLNLEPPLILISARIPSIRMSARE